MIELSTSVGYRNSVTINQLTWRQQKTKLEKKLLIISLLVGIIFIAFLVDACITSNVDSQTRCQTYHCILAASQIIKQIDQTIKPCDDFFHFACGKMVQQTHYKNIPTNVLHTKVRHQIRQILKEPIKENDHPAVKDEKMLFQSCIKEVKNGVSLEVLKSILNELNGWPVLMGNLWKEDNFHWVETVTKLKKQGLPCKALFRAYVIKHGLSKNIIQIVSPRISANAKKHKHVFKNYLKDIAIIFGANETAARKEMGEVFEFIIKLDKLDYYSDNSSRSIKKEISITDLQGRYPNVNWINYFRTVLSINATMEQYVALPHPNYMDRLFDLMDKTPKRTVANYVFWFAISDFLSVTTEHHLNIENELNCLNNYEEIQMVDACDTAMRIIFSPRPSEVLFAIKYVSSSNKKMFKLIYDHIISEIKSVLKTTLWLDANAYKNATGWLNTIKTVMAMPESDINQIFNKYTKIDNIQKPFLKNYLERRTQVVKNFDDEYTSTLFYFVSDIGVTYIHRTILVPSGFLHGMYMNQDWPMYLNFAGLGREIATKLSFELTVQLKLKDSDILLSSELFKIFENATSCITHNLEDMSNTFTFKHMKMAAMNGITFAYLAYKKWLQNHPDDLRLLGVDYNPDQLFWLWTFSDACYDDSEQYIRFNYYVDNEVIRHNIYFARDFKCELDSKMNPRNKCNII